MTFQPAPRNAASSSWMIWPLPRTGPSRRCRLQLMTKIRLSSFSRAGSVIAPSASGSSVSPSPRNAHTFALERRLQPAIFEVAHEARLIDRHDRAEAHRHRRVFPEVGHQPRMRVRRQAAARLQLAAEVLEMRLVDAPFEIGARVDARRRVTLEKDHVRRRRLRLPAEEVVEARPRTASPPTRTSKCGRRCLLQPCSRGRPWPRHSSARGS